MPGADEIGASGIVVGQRPDRRGALLGRDAGRRAVPVIDRDRERGAVDRVVVGDHRREVQPARGLAGDRRADDAAGIADDERHLLGGGVNGGDDQVALVLAVVIVGDDDDLAAGEGVDGFANAGLRHVLYSPNPFSREKSRIALAQLQYREPPQYRTRRSARAIRIGRMRRCAGRRRSGAESSSGAPASRPALRAGRPRSVKVPEQPPLFPLPARRRPRPRARRSPSRSRRAAARGAAPAAAAAGRAPEDVRVRAPAGPRRSADRGCWRIATAGSPAGGLARRVRVPAAPDAAAHPALPRGEELHGSSSISSSRSHSVARRPMIAVTRSRAPWIR